MEKQSLTSVTLDQRRKAPQAPRGGKNGSGRQPQLAKVGRKVEKAGAGAAVGVWYRRGIQFLIEAKSELKRVKWPTRKELLASTAVVLVLTLIVALFLGVVDFGLIKVIRLLVG